MKYAKITAAALAAMVMGTVPATAVYAEVESVSAAIPTVAEEGPQGNPTDVPVPPKEDARPENAPELPHAAEEGKEAEVPPMTAAEENGGYEVLPIIEHNENGEYEVLPMTPENDPSVMPEDIAEADDPQSGSSIEQFLAEAMDLLKDSEDSEEADSIVDQIRSLLNKLQSLLRANRTENDEAERPAESDEEEDDESSRSEMTDEDTERPGMPGEEAGEDGEESGRPGESMGEDQNAPDSYSAAAEVTEDSTGASYTSSAEDENAVLVSGDTVTISDAVVTKTGSSDGEDADFYGINAAVLANDGAALTLSGITVTTEGTHANGVFSYGSGTSVVISDSEITTSGNNSGGLMVTGGGSITANNLTVTTSGNSSAAIRSDRGGGTATVTDGTYTTSGVGSPAIYSTADITVSSAELSASNSEAVVIEGGNSVTLTDCDITGNDATLNGQSTTATNVLIYQSMSGDAQEGTASFTMSGGSLTALTGAMFHVTNTTAVINLSGVTMNYASDSDDLLIISADSWGTSGSNGGDVTMNLSNQSVSGNITVDSISSLTINMTDSSDYTGAINTTGDAGTVNVVLEEGSTWTLTGDSYITSFDGDYSSINLNGYKLYVNGVLVG